jgi:AcrR family transcriptional regulator
MTKDLTGRAKQALATKTKIYKCGVRLLEQHGYDNITVEQIARKANVSVGTYYHYFPSKFDLLVEFYRQGDLFFKTQISELLYQHNNCAERITAYFALYAQLAIDNGIEMIRKLYVPTNTMFITQGRIMQDLLTDILRQGQENGELTDTIAAEAITEKLFVVARGVIFDWCLRDGKSDLIADIKEFIGNLVKTYLLALDVSKSEK